MFHIIINRPNLFMLHANYKVVILMIYNENRKLLMHALGYQHSIK